MTYTLATFVGSSVEHSHSRGVTNVHREYGSNNEKDYFVDSIVILGQHSGKVVIIKFVWQLASFIPPTKGVSHGSYEGSFLGTFWDLAEMT